MRRILNTVFTAAIGLSSFTCSQKANFERVDQGVVVNLENAPDSTKTLKVEVLADDIFHVTASATDTFSRATSLMIVQDRKHFSDWTATEQNGSLVVATSKISAHINLKTGEVNFKDSLGQSILTEQQGGGKSFVATKIDQQNAFNVRQIFESTDDEAFYGLGGHQNGQMNYKGEDVELIQHNIVDVVPFVYSSKNYGILWDNYSISKFGDPRDYLPLNSLKLTNKVGQPGSLTATYFVGDKVFKTQEEEKIDYEYLETPAVDSFPKDVAQRGKVLWEGSISSDVEGKHKFLVYASGYFKVWLDNKLIMDKWRQGWNPWTNKFTVDMKPGTAHSLKVEWTPDGGAYIAVKHLDPLAEVEQQKLSLFSEVADQIDYYFVYGKNADDVIQGYRELTGKAPIVPKWAMGFWQSRERYKNQNEIVEVVKEYRKRNIPLDNIVLDWQYWEDPKWGSHEFDSKRFPDPQGMINELHNELNANLMISVWPKFNKGTSNFEEMEKNGFLFVRNIEKQRKDWVGVGYESTFYDPFNADAGKLFWKQIDANLNKIGVDGWWLDATEPDMHSNLSIEERKINMSPTAIGPGAKYFNAYSLMNSKSVYEGSRKSSPEKRVFILTRSAYAGQQRYGATTWSGDIVSRWSDFQDQIATGINFSLSGIPYWTMDIGGFSVEKRYEKPSGETQNEWRELNTRWFQFGTFCPIFRSHGQYPFREIWNIAPEGHDAYESMVYYDKLRYRLMPYIYTLAGQSYLSDYTIMRGLVMDFNSDKNVHSIGDQYMFGPSLLINPVYTFKATSRKVYLPEQAGWYDLYTGKYLEGGQMLDAPAPYKQIPVFVKSGSIIPAGPELQFTDEKKADPLTLYIYEGANAEFDLYEDEGINYNYEQGNYSVIKFHYDDKTKSLTIHKRKGEFSGMLNERNFEIVWVSKDRPAGLGLTAQPDQVVNYKGDEVKIQKQN